MIQPGQIYRSCDPRGGPRIRIERYTPGDARAHIVDALTGKRFRQILVKDLHESPVTATGRRRRGGYVLDRHTPNSPSEVLGAPGSVPEAPGGELAAQDGDSGVDELTAEEARNLVDELGLQLYRTQDALAYVEECCVIAEREGRAITTADVRKWLKGACCGRQLAVEKTPRVFAALHRSAEQDVSRVIALYEQWVKAGPPPLGTSINRWWDARLVELHNAIQPPQEQP